MSLKLIFITNIPEIALIAEKNGVDRIMIDLEMLGKEERQKNMNTVKSHHTVADVEKVSKVLTVSETLVRINPWNENSLKEIEEVISVGADRIMLPMWKSTSEVSSFLNAVNGRVATTLLLETKEAVEIIDGVLQNSLIDEIHIGLNDLHLSYGLTFMFELLSNGVVESLCNKFRVRGIEYGFGGIARIGEGELPAERILMEHYRLGSSRAILSRSFCNSDQSLEEIERIFKTGMRDLRNFEESMRSFSEREFERNKNLLKQKVESIGKEKNVILTVETDILRIRIVKEIRRYETSDLLQVF